MKRPLTIIAAALLATTGLAGRVDAGPDHIWVAWELPATFTADNPPNGPAGPEFFPQTKIAEASTRQGVIDLALELSDGCFAQVDEYPAADVAGYGDTLEHGEDAAVQAEYVDLDNCSTTTTTLAPTTTTVEETTTTTLAPTTTTVEETTTTVLLGSEGPTTTVAPSTTVRETTTTTLAPAVVPTTQGAVQAGPTTISILPATGSDAQDAMIPIAIGLVLMGGALVLATRRTIPSV